MPFDHIYSSDSLRARQTAEAITQFSGHTLQFDQRLREKNLGIFEGLTTEEARERHPEVFRLFKTAGSQYVIDEGESTQQLLDRALEAIEVISHRHQTSGRTCLASYTRRCGAGSGEAVLWGSEIWMHPTRFLIQEYRTVFRLVWEDKWMVEQMGGVSHLE